MSLPGLVARAVYRIPAKAGMTTVGLLYHLAAIDAPELHLLHVAGIVVDRQLAPLPVAGKNITKDVRRELGHGLRRGEMKVSAAFRSANPAAMALLLSPCIVRCELLSSS